jgi:hypothetical protein
MAQTSDRVSKIAGKYARLDSDLLLSLTATREIREATARDIRTLAASVLRQDETKGLRSLIRKVLK